jgi:tyrosyl-DNA phosphodiesterase 2
LCGDFNFCSTWPEENQNIPPDFRDLWPILHPNEPGWTEDTAINIMRYEMKHSHKQVRFDRVLLFASEPVNNRFVPEFMELVGTEHIPNNGAVWPSDHFGLFTRFVIRS